MSETHFLAPAKIKICRRDGQLWLKMDGQKVRLAPPKRALPLSQPERFIVLSAFEGGEIGIIKNLTKLAPESRQIVREELERAYEVLRISRVLEVEREAMTGQIRWRVEIENGEDSAPPIEVADERKGVLRVLRRAPKAIIESEPDRIAREREFRLAGGEDVQTARYPQIYLVDTEGRRYEIPNCETLDFASRRAAERFL